MSFKVILRNVKKNRHDNLIYFLTMVIAIAACYIALSLGRQDVMLFLRKFESSAVNRLLAAIMPAVYISALLFVLFLVIFANKYQLECRSRELGLYLLFGMKKKQLFLYLMEEALLSAIFSIFPGIICGGFLSEIVSLVTSRLIGQGIISHQSSFSISAVLWTTIGFLVIQAVALAFLGSRLFHQELFSLLYGNAEKKHKTGKIKENAFALITGIALLLITYWLLWNHLTDAGGMIFLLVVLTGITGTILLICGSSRLLILLATLKRKKSTHGLYTFTLRQLQENVTNKYISISAASILMALTLMFISACPMYLSIYRNALDRSTDVYDFTVYGNDKDIKEYLSSKKMKPYVSGLNRMETGQIKSSLTVDWSELRKQVVSALPKGAVDPNTADSNGYYTGPDQAAELNLLSIIDETGSSPKLIPISKYNQLLDSAGEQMLQLSDHECVLYINPDFSESILDDVQKKLTQIATDSEKESQIKIGEDVYSVVSSVPMKGLTADRNARVSTALIVPDNVYQKYVNSDTVEIYWNFCVPKSLFKTDGMISSIMKVNNILYSSGFTYESYLNNFGRQLFRAVTGSYITLYLGFMLLIIACALLALHFLTQMQTTKQRYLILSFLGTRREQIKKSIYKQVRIYFMIPLLPACVSGFVGMKLMEKDMAPVKNQTAAMNRMNLLLFGIVILVLTIYAFVIAKTADKEITELKWKPNS